MREIPTKKRMEVLKLYFMGHSYDEIAKMVDVAKGSVVNIVKELKEGRYPEFESLLDLIDELRNLAIEVKKSNLKVPQASLGLKFYRRVQDLGVEPQILDAYIKMCEGISPPGFPVDRFINAAVSLHRLEERLNKPYDVAINDLEKALEEKSSRLGEVCSQIEALEVKKTRLENELKELEVRLTSVRTELGELIKGVESLEKLGIDKVCKLSAFGRECEKLGYSVDKLIELAKLVDEKASVEKQASTLKSRLATLNEEIKRAERERLATIAKNRRLSVVSGILESRKTSVACSYCKRTIIMPVPSTWQLEDAMKKGLIYPARCHYCRYINEVSPRYILESIAWSILTA